MKATCFLPCLIAIPLSGMLWAQEKSEPPVIEKQIEPDYPPDLKSFLIDSMSVEMVVDQDGIPFSLKSESALTNNIVEALSQWRFRPARKNGAATAAAVTIRLPIHRPIGEMLWRMKRSWNDSKELHDAIAAAKDLDGSKAMAQEGELGPNVENPNARLVLLAFAATAPGPAAAQMRLRQILWFAKNMPDAEILGTPLAVPNPPDLSAEALFGQIRQIWLAQLADHPKDSVILDRATNFLRFTDPELVDKAARQAISENNLAEVVLGDLYGLTVLGVTAVDPATGRASNAGPQLPTTPFAVKARSFLTNTQNLNVFFSGASTVSDAGPSLAKAGHLPEGYLGLCQELLARAKSYDSETRLSCDTTEPAAAVRPTVPTRIRIGGNVQAANLIKKVQPTYPQEAKARGITGTVEFSAIIAKDGSVRILTYLGGPLPLYKSAYDSVMRWRYKPTQLNGNPVEVVTRIDVSYTLN